jgi:hypothetical protein
MGPECIVLVAASGCLLGKRLFLMTYRLFLKCLVFRPSKWCDSWSVHADQMVLHASVLNPRLSSYPIYFSHQKKKKDNLVFFLIARPSNGRHVSPATKNTKDPKIPLSCFFFSSINSPCFDRPLLFSFSSVFTFAFYLHFWVLMTVRSVRSWTGKGYLLNKLKIGIDTSCGI